MRTQHVLQRSREEPRHIIRPAADGEHPVRAQLTLYCLGGRRSQSPAYAAWSPREAQMHPRPPPQPSISTIDPSIAVRPWRAKVQIPMEASRRSEAMASRVRIDPVQHSNLMASSVLTKPSSGAKWTTWKKGWRLAGRIPPLTAACVERLASLNRGLTVWLRWAMDGVIEIITGRERRRRWSTEEKLRIWRRQLSPARPVRSVAARNGICENFLYTWRRQVREGTLREIEAPAFVPVRVFKHR